MAGAGDGHGLHAGDVLQGSGGGDDLESRSWGIEALGGAVPVDLAVLGDGGGVHRVEAGQTDLADHLAGLVIQHHHCAVLAHGQLVPPEEFDDLGAQLAVQAEVNIVALAGCIGEQRVEALRQRGLEAVEVRRLEALHAIGDLALVIPQDVYDGLTGVLVRLVYALTIHRGGQENTVAVIDAASGDGGFLLAHTRVAGISEPAVAIGVDGVDTVHGE